MLVDYIRTNYNRNRPKLLLKFLSVVDLFFILGHIYALYGRPSDLRHFKVDADKGYPEIFKYLKFLAIVAIIAHLVFSQKKRAYFLWGCVFFLLFMDDAFQAHEKVGRYIAHIFGLEPMMGLKDRDLGELVYMICVGSGVLAVMVFTYIY